MGSHGERDVAGARRRRPLLCPPGLEHRPRIATGTLARAHAAPRRQYSLCRDGGAPHRVDDQARRPPGRSDQDDQRAADAGDDDVGGREASPLMIGGVIAPGLPIPHRTLELLLPGFTGLSLGSFALGLIETFLFG